MISYKDEYRVNKNGAECFRASSYEEARDRLADLKSKKPNAVYDIQSQHVRVDRYGVMERNYRGRPAWSPWF